MDMIRVRVLNDVVFLFLQPLTFLLIRVTISPSRSLLHSFLLCLAQI